MYRLYTAKPSIDSVHTHHKLLEHTALLMQVMSSKDCVKLGGQPPHSLPTRLPLHSGSRLRSMDIKGGSGHVPLAASLHPQ